MMEQNTRSYRLKTMRLDQVWLPFSFMALFMIIGIVCDDGQKYYDLTRIYLSTVMPLVTGILAAYALLDDPTLELKFSTSVSMPRLLFGKLGLILAIQLVTAAAMEGFAAFAQVDLTVFGSFWQLQLVWLVPCLAAMGFGCFMALLGAAPMSGAITIGLVWIVQAILHSFFAADRIARYFFLFMGGLDPTNSSLFWNRVTLLGLSVAFLLAGLMLLRRQERYL
jgi:hypothetical protein